MAKAGIKGVFISQTPVGTTFWCGSSNHQAATAQMHLVEKNIVECPAPLGALPLSLIARGPEVPQAAAPHLTTPNIPLIPKNKMFLKFLPKFFPFKGCR